MVAIRFPHLAGHPRRTRGNLDSLGLLRRDPSPTVLGFRVAAVVNALQLGLSIVLLGAFCVIVLCREVFWRMQPISAERGFPAPVEFAEQIATYGPSNEAAALAFAQRAQDVYTQRRESSKRLEDKAASILSFVGGGSGLIALVAGTDKVVHVQFTLLLASGSAFLFGVFLSTILVQVPRSSAVFNARRLCDPALLGSYAGAARVAAISGWEYLEAARDGARLVRIKAKWLTYAQITFAFGVAAIVLNVLCSPAQSDDSANATAAHCTVATGTIDCRIAPSKKSTP
jgi:hypothetical protein